jgi:hypothetical protein
MQALLSVSAIAADYPTDLFVVTQLSMDAVRQPHGMDTLLSARDSRQIRASVSKFMGIKNSYLNLSTNAPTAEAKGEETFYNLPLPAGYAACAARINVVSIVPASGERASFLHAAVRTDSAGVYTWTPRRQAWEGRSWVEADLQLLGIKAEYQQEFQKKGVCGQRGANDWDLAKCRGNPCVATPFGKLETAGQSTERIRALPTISWQAKAIDPATFSVSPQPLQFASLPVPNLAELRTCRSTMTNQDEFFGCMTESSLPRDYQVTKACIRSNKSDPARAVVCSTGRQDLLNTYDKAAAVQKCARSAKDDAEVALCVGTQILGPRELHYAHCLSNNRTDYIQAAVCGLAQDLSPEQQIALSCAMKTGLVPKAFAICTGGKLFEREVTKCWDNGIGTEAGCFGPNNEIRKYWSATDDLMRSTLGESNDIYKAFKNYKDNVLIPGPNHEFIKVVNIAQRDLKNGPGPNNDLVKASNIIGEGIQSVGETIGGLVGF